MVREETTTYEEGVENDDNRERNADECEFKESEGRKSCSRESAGNDDVWRSTDHGDGTADVSCDSKRHQFLRSRDLCCLADTNDDWHQAGYCTGVRRNRGQDDRNDHDSCHERNLVGAGFLNYSYTDSFSEASLEHSGADNEHTAEKYDGGIGETCVNLFRREYAQNPQCSTCCHSGNSQRNQFGNEEKCCYGQDTQCGNGWIHKGSPSF